MRKFLISIITLIILGSVLLTTGCSGNKTKTTKTTTAPTYVPEGVTISPNGKEIYFGSSKEGKERIKISFTLAGYGDEWLKVWATHFVTEYPEYWILLDGDPGLTDSLSTKLEAGLNLSDMYFALNSPWATYASYGYLEDLSDVYSAKPDGEDKQSIYEKASPLWQNFCTAEYMGEEGKYALPWTEAVSGLAYNKTMFDKYGWEVPVTMDDMLALCEQILSDTNGKVAPFVYPGTVGGYYGYLVSQWWLQSAGLEGVKEFYKFESVEVYNYNKYPRKGLYDALKAYDSLFGSKSTKYSLRGSMSKNHIEAQLSFLRGEAAMIPNASWLECEMKEDIPEGFDLRLMRAPYLSNAKKDDSGDYIKVSYGTHPDYVIVPKQAQNIEGAKKFLIYTASEEMLKLFTIYSGALRPFEYDVMSIYDEVSNFTKSCIDIWYGADEFFECSPAKVYKKSLVDMYITMIPYAAITYGVDNGGTTVEQFLRSEYVKALDEWDTWMAKANR